MNDLVSDCTTTTCGVPQGTVMAPLFSQCMSTIHYIHVLKMLQVITDDISILFQGLVGTKYYIIRN